MHVELIWVGVCGRVESITRVCVRGFAQGFLLQTRIGYYSNIKCDRRCLGTTPRVQLLKMSTWLSHLMDYEAPLTKRLNSTAGSIGV